MMLGLRLSFAEVSAHKSAVSFELEMVNAKRERRRRTLVMVIGSWFFLGGF
jgi:hypothetical protein